MYELYVFGKHKLQICRLNDKPASRISGQKLVPKKLRLVGLGRVENFQLAVGWVGSVSGWVGLGWVTENGPTDNLGVRF
mgnify:CR=1 FL=1